MSDKNCNCKSEPKQSLVSHVAEKAVKTAVGVVAGAVVTAVLGPVAGEITRTVVTGDVLG